MKKKLFWVYMASIFVLFLAVGFIARQWFVGADTDPENVLADINFKDSTVWLQECSRSDKCPIMKIICEQSGHASYSSTEDCVIYANNSYCRSASLQENTTNNLDADQLRNFATKIESTSNNPSACVVLHEIAHACDKSINDQNRNKMCSEVGAEQAEFACRRKITDRICSSVPTNPLCVSACQDFQEKLPATVWDTCMCAGSSSIGGVDNSVCCSCVKECKNITYYNKLMPASCGKLDSDVLNRVCDYASIGSTHNCGYYAVGARDASKVCKFYDFNPRVCERTAEYFEETKDKAQMIADNECKNSVWVHPGGEADEAVYSRAILNYVKNMICADCELSGEGKCSRPDRCMVSAGYIKYTCIDESCDQGGTTPVKVRGIRNALNPTSANVGASTVPPLTGLSFYAQRKNEFYQNNLDAPRIFLGTTDESGVIETSLTIGQWEIIAQKEGYQTLSQVVTVQRGQPLNLDLNMVQTGTPPPPPPAADKTLNINVRDALLVSQSRPVYGATVRITKGSTNFTKTTATPTGEAIFENLEAGIWNIEVTKSGYAISSSSPTTVNVASLANQANIIMERAMGTLSVETTDKTLSTRIPGVSVTIRSDNITKTQVTDSNGSTVFSDLLENRTWTLTGTKTGYHQEEPSTAQTYDYGRVIMDSDTRNLTVRVKTTSGTNMANVTAKISGPGGTVTKTTTSNGEAVFNNAKIGSNTITLSRSGWEISPNQTTTVDLQENMTKELVMQRTKNLTVKVKTNSGTNMANVTVKLSNQDGTITKITNSVGEAAFTDLKVGQRTIALVRSGWTLTPNQATTFDLQGDTTKNLVMQRAGNFKFYTLGRALSLPVPLSKATVKFCNKPLGDATKICREQTTNLAGISTFTNYLPGTYYYEARANNYTTRAGSVTIIKQTTGSLMIQLEKR